MCLIGLKWRAVFLPQGLGENLILTFSGFSRSPCSSSGPSQQSYHSTPSHTSPSLTLTFLFPSFTYEDPCGSLGPSGIMQDNLPISGSFTQSHLRSPFCHVRSHIRRFQGLGDAQRRGAVIVLLQGWGWWWEASSKHFRKDPSPFTDWGANLSSLFLWNWGFKLPLNLLSDFILVWKYRGEYLKVYK